MTEYWAEKHFSHMLEVLTCSNLMRTEGCQGSVWSAALSTVQCEETNRSHRLITYSPHAGKQEPAGRT